KMLCHRTVRQSQALSSTPFCSSERWGPPAFNPRDIELLDSLTCLRPFYTREGRVFLGDAQPIIKVIASAITLCAVCSLVRIFHTAYIGRVLSLSCNSIS